MSLALGRSRCEIDDSVFPVSRMKIRQLATALGQTGSSQVRCMTKSRNQTNKSNRDEFADFVAAEVERVLVRHDDTIDTPTLVSAGKIAGGVAAAITFLSPKHQRAIDAIQGELTGLASEFVRALAVEAGRRSETGAAGGERENLPSAPPAGIESPAPTSPRNPADDLDSVLIEDWAGRVAGSTYLEENFRIPRSTLHRWQKRNEVVALRKGGRKHVFPLAQFIDGRPAPGISEVLSLIVNPRMAWLWLIRPSSDLDGRVPIEMLRQDLVDAVVLAARGFLST
jgi:hypothetical protein